MSVTYDFILVNTDFISQNKKMIMVSGPVSLALVYCHTWWQYPSILILSDTGLLQPESVDLQNQEEDLHPNLHLLGQLFLSRPMSHAFNCILLFQL